MKKQKVSMTLDEDLIAWVNNQPEYKSASEFVNEILRKEHELNTDIFGRLEALDYEESRISKKRETLAEELDRMLTEGNRKQRDEAEKKIIEVKESLEKEEVRKKQSLNNFLAFLNELDLGHRIKECSNKEDFMKLINEMARKIFDNNLAYMIPYADITFFYNELIEKKVEVEA